MLTGFFELHIEGGSVVMYPLLVLLIVNIGLIIYVLIARSQKKLVHSKWLVTIKQIGGLAAAYGAFGTVVGLIQAFNALENSPEIIPFPVICGGLKVAALNVVYGLAILCISQLAYIILKLSDSAHSSQQ